MHYACGFRAALYRAGCHTTRLRCPRVTLDYNTLQLFNYKFSERFQQFRICALELKDRPCRNLVLSVISDLSDLFDGRVSPICRSTNEYVGVMLKAILCSMYGLSILKNSSGGRKGFSLTNDIGCAPII
jgi:hypothetical protein